MYLVFDGPFTIETDQHSLSISFSSPTRVHIGARSKHQRPAHTIETSTDPTDLMEAISTFRSALKTTSPERSFPTLRGHPPRLELADSLNIPDAISSNPTDLTIEVPPEISDIIPTTPLAYYLGANVESGSEPRITSDTGWSYSLGDRDELEQNIARVLKHVFFFDCVTRTEGHYPVKLTEREALTDRVDIDFEVLYDLPQPERLRAYLEYPLQDFEDLLPLWPAHAKVQVRESSIPYLPFLANDLTTISSVPAELSESVERPSEIETTYQPVIEQIWIGSCYIEGYTKAIKAGYEHRLNLEPTDGTTRIAVVLNDPEFDFEGSEVTQRYGANPKFDFEVILHEDLETDALVELIQQDIDFLHYIGHVTEDGIQCSDGYVDVRTISSVGVTYFLLNACHSARQGIHLVEAGSVGGIVTISEVIDSTAAWFGVNLAKLLDAGFPLRAALKILEPLSLQGTKYQVVGTGSEVVSTHESVPVLTDATLEEDRADVIFTLYPSDRFNTGSIAIQLTADEEVYCVIPSTLRWSTTREELLNHFKSGLGPVHLNGELFWSQEIDSLPTDSP